MGFDAGAHIVNRQLGRRGEQADLGGILHGEVVLVSGKCAAVHGRHHMAARRLPAHAHPPVTHHWQDGRAARHAPRARGLLGHAPKKVPEDLALGHAKPAVEGALAAHAAYEKCCPARILTCLINVVANGPVLAEEEGALEN